MLKKGEEGGGNMARGQALPQARRASGVKAAAVYAGVLIALALAWLLILNCGSLMSVGFEKALLLQNSLNISASQIISTYVYNTGLTGGQFSFASAVGLFNSVVNLILILLVNSVARKLNDTSLW